ncbi:hypothetical protein CAPTEDRAFT_191306 [Capitella teleta]|uniref:Uncharacterized protein n=1 Tax=Capitella teleta TaxID=283909 RepID=R7U698_CAPTE|nr:hypothetical protein CAPTEDRAFT_191306 [Capitella teleta]|eukprot:ELU01880.1 hypothetical protein CAPTEDRAFT_191306 [Capitella teleta]
MWAALCESSMYEQIDHIYLIRGHTFLPNDRDFALIEKYKRKQEVLLPTDYVRIIEDTRTTQPFKVEVMQSIDMMDFKSLGDQNVKAQMKSVDGEKVKMREVMWFSYGASQDYQLAESGEMEWVTVPHGQQVWCRFTHNTMEPWKKMNFLKRGKAAGGVPTRKHTGPVALKEAKYRDLVAIGRKGLVPEEVKEYYESLPHDGARALQNTNPDDSSDDEYDYADE